MATNTTVDVRGDLKATLKRLGFTHEKVSEAVGCGRSTVSLWLQGEVSSPALDMAIPAFVHGLEMVAAKKTGGVLKMSPSLEAASEINGLWIECLGGLEVKLATCPSNERVAEVIEKHFPEDVKLPSAN